MMRRFRRCQARNARLAAAARAALRRPANCAAVGNHTGELTYEVRRGGASARRQDAARLPGTSSSRCAWTCAASTISSTAAPNGRPSMPRCRDSAAAWRAAWSSVDTPSAGAPLRGGLSPAVHCAQSAAAPEGVLRGRPAAHGRFGHRYGRRPIGSSARRSTCSASCSRGIRICAACSPTTASSVTRSARTSRSAGTSRCATIRRRRRVVYQPVSIEPRVLVPKVIRHDNRYDPALSEAKPDA